MKLVKVFADHTTMLTAAVHQSGSGFIIRQYDRSLRAGLVGTTSAPNFTRACAIAAGFVYQLEAAQ